MKLTLERLALLILPRAAAGGFFSPSERRTLVAAAEVLLDGCPVEISTTEVVKNLEDFLQLSHSRRAWRIRVLVVLIELAPLFLLGRRRFSRQSVTERRRLIEEKYIHGRSVWAICAKVKQLIHLGVYGSPRAEKVIGYVRWEERPRSMGMPDAFPDRMPKKPSPPKLPNPVPRPEISI